MSGNECIPLSRFMLSLSEACLLFLMHISTCLLIQWSVGRNNRHYQSHPLTSGSLCCFEPSLKVVIIFGDAVARQPNVCIVFFRWLRKATVFSLPGHTKRKPTMWDSIHFNAHDAYLTTWFFWSEGFESCLYLKGYRRTLLVCGWCTYTLSTYQWWYMSF